MIRHETPCEHLPAVLRRHCSELFGERLAVLSVPDDGALVVPARDDVVDRLSVDDAKLPAHTENVRRRMSPNRPDFATVSDTRAGL
jgi:hypothetical protein